MRGGALDLPPLFSDEAAGPEQDPVARAVARAGAGCDAGLITHAVSRERLAAALVLAPEVPLAQAAGAFVACAVGFQNAFGALAPPETALYLTWPGEILVNGARAGALRLLCATDDPAAVPGWLVVGLELQLDLPAGLEPGRIPDRTALALEGCGDIAPQRLIEAWARHTLVWLDTLEATGPAPLRRAWEGLIEEIGQPVALSLGGTVHAGVFEAIDDSFAMHLRMGEETRTLPLTALIEPQPDEAP